MLHRVRTPYLCLACFVFLVTLAAPVIPVSAGSTVEYCNDTPRPSWCDAVRGDRPGTGWLAQGRSEVMARNGMVSTSQPLAAQAGLRILMAGGNAIDAAVATAAVLNLVEPMNVGIGGDMFAIIYSAKDKKLYQLNAGGMAPTGATVDHYNSLGYKYDPNNWGYGSGMPLAGILSAPVPSAAWGWDEAIHKFGTMSLKQVLQPAIEYAEKGFPVSDIIGSGAAGWQVPNALDCHAPDAQHILPYCTRLDPDTVAAWYLNGKPPKAGQIFRNPELARTFRLFAKYGRSVFYKGEIARAIVAKSRSLGGTMTMDDLARYYGEWVEAPHTNYHGYEIYESMAPSQAWNVLELMNILDVCTPEWIPGQTLANLGPANPQYWHLIVEAKKLAYIDLYNYNSDPRFWTENQQQLFKKLISKEYASSLCGKVNPNGPAFTPGPTYNGDTGAGDTIYLTTADRWGNMVSWINSNYMGFGSGVTIPGYGFVLNCRLGQFTLNPNHPNKIEPHKRPYDTISCGFVMKDGKPLMTLGLMGGDMQVQGHEQMLVNMLDLGANLQASTDMARYYHQEIQNKLNLETQLFNLVGAALRDKYGHKVAPVTGSDVGGYQAIMFEPSPAYDSDSALGGGVKPINGFYRAGSDHRKDGEAVGW